MPRCWAYLLVLAVCGGCSDEGDPLEAGTNAGPAVSFEEEIQPIFDANCVECHGAAGNGNLDLRAPQSYANLVDVPAFGYDARRVVPAEPGSSVLYSKVVGDELYGDRMPLGGPYLPAVEIRLIHDWIERGATP